MDWSTLNPQQRLAVETIRGPVLVLAGAGSGKTRALTCRVAHLLEQGVPAYQILAITFTNKAAREMRERINKLTNGQAGEAWVSTFHACCARILRRDIEKLGYQRAFSIYDDDDQISVIKDLLKKQNIDDKVLAPREIKTRISDAKNHLLGPDEWFQQSAKDYRCQMIADVYREYENRLKASSALDFDDLLVKTLELFAQHPPVLEAYQRRFQYIHVDEYQDTNHAQYMLVRLLAGETRNVCVVGDDDQSVYGWRGADIRNILEFEQDYPDCTVIKLEQNYRSTSNILDAANNIVAHNAGRKEKTLWTQSGEGAPIKLFTAGDEREEAAWVCDRIHQLQQGGEALGGMAVLYRMNAQSRVLEEMLVRANIPYRVVGGTRFYDRREVKDIIAYLRSLVNPLDDVSLHRIINTPRRAIGDATIAELTRAAAAQQASLFHVMLDPPESLASRARKSVGDFALLLTSLMAERETMPVGDFVEHLVRETKLEMQYLKEDSDDARTRVENMREFIGAVREYEQKTEEPTLEGFLENVALVTDLDGLPETAQSVTLMTLHSAKGLEFDTVFLVGLEQGLFPSYMAVNEGRIEEERRLAYVGVTRARKQLFISYATQRMLFNQMQRNAPSQFIEEIPPRLLDDEWTHRTKPMINPAVKTREQIAAARQAHISSRNFAGGRSGALNIPGVQQGFSPSLARKFADQAAQVALFQPGDRVLHRKFGEGNVVEVRGAGGDCRIVIEFTAYGTKEFAASIAPIVKVE
ncbi:MAG: DNA helicase PcrA [Oscillospiraceae bacterium]|nr:DNA helicase PcrA [Oscillospiraceae bacterium]